MVLPFRGTCAKVVVCALLCATTEVSQGAKPHQAATGFSIGPSKGQVIGAAAGIGAVAAAIGFGIYYGTHHNHNLTGCAGSGAAGLQLQNEGDKQTYDLLGDVNAIKTGDRVRVSGKKKKVAGSSRTFLVERLPKDLGPCKVKE